MSIWDGCTPGSSEIACGFDDNGASPKTVSLSPSLTNGNTYYIQLHRIEGLTTASWLGNIQILATSVPTNSSQPLNCGTGNNVPSVRDDRIAL